MTQDRKVVRKQIHALRERLSVEQRRGAAEKAAEFLIASSLFRESQHIACYMSKGAEISAQPIINAIWACEKHCYLPVLHPEKKGYLCFIEYSPNDELVQDKFGIEEPVYDPSRVIENEALDLVVTPLTAFDQQGHRIGMGGGYYDRTFAFTLSSDSSVRPVLCGLAYALQELPHIHAESWDVTLQAVVTEQGARFKI